MHMKMLLFETKRAVGVHKHGNLKKAAERGSDMLHRKQQWVCKG